MKKYITLSLLLILFLSLLPGCKQSKKTYPNLLFITVDTTRADHLSCYGYKKAYTPYIQALANAGTVFDNMQSCVPITLPSHTTMFTGLTPPEHGVRVNGENALSEKIPTLAEILKAKGYNTGAVTASSVVESIYGLNRGFDYYEDKLDHLKSPGLQVAGNAQDMQYRHAGTQARLSIEWLTKMTSGENAGKPWFLWTHFYDPHHPLHTHKKLFGDHFKDPYDAEIAFMDSQLGRILEFLGKKNIKENTIVVVVADHGEGLGEHDADTHCFFLYETTQHVPCIFVWKGVVPAGKRVPASLSLADIMPTLLDLMGIKPDIYKPRNDPRNKRLLTAQKRSFAGAFRGETIEDRPCYMETLWGYFAVKWAPIFGLLEGKNKFIKAPRCELFDLKTDPHELHNLYSKTSRIADEMSAQLDDWERSMKKPELKELSLSAEQLNKLQSLGYTSGGANDTSDAAMQDLEKLIDPKDMTEIIRIMAQTKVYFKEDPKNPKLFSNCRKLVEAAPETAQFQAWMGRAFAEKGKEKEALECYKKALKLNPEQINVQNNYGLILAKFNRHKEALPHFEKAWESKKHDPALKNNLCLTLEKLGMQAGNAKDYAGAEKYFSRCIELQPDNPKSHFNYGQLMKLQGRTDEASKAFDEALKINPSYRRAQIAKKNLNALGPRR